MSEIQLSDDLNVITAEINSYKQVAGQAIFEIGKRLKHVKEKDLVHGEWLKWLESIEIHERQAQRMMKVSSELSSNSTTWSELPFRALYEIATLPQEEREKEHVTSKGETKTVDEMTVRELQELKKQIKEKDRQIEQAQKSEEIALRKLEEAENREPEVIEKEVVKEIVPLSFKEKLESAERKLNFINKENERLRKENDSYQMKDTEKFDEEAAKAELRKLHIEADRNTAEIRIVFKQLNDKVSVSRYMYEAISAGSDYEKKKIEEELSITKEIISSIEASLKNRRVVN